MHTYSPSLSEVKPDCIYIYTCIYVKMIHDLIF